MPEKVGILLDGGFLIKKLASALGRFPISQDVATLSEKIMQQEPLNGTTLLRILFYHAPPFQGTLKNPIDQQKVDFSKTGIASKTLALLSSLELRPNFAVRRGELVEHGWKIGEAALKDMTRNPRPIAARDLVPHLEQKGVDMRIGLDIAWLAMKRIVDVLVLVAGDSDFVPAMKFARKEGLRVYLVNLGHRVRTELKVHADDIVLIPDLPSGEPRSFRGRPWKTSRPSSATKPVPAPGGPPAPNP